MKTKYMLSLLLFLGFAQLVLGQTQKEIKLVFDTYGKQKGSILVQLSTDVLSEGSNMSFYKSLMMGAVTQRDEKQIVAMLFSNKQSWEIISEVSDGGVVQSGSYHVQDWGVDNEYLLFKRLDNKLTIVYIRGRFPPKKLDNEIKKLKNLFIYTNNKKIKLN